MVVGKETWPGDFLLHPISLGAITVLIVNDWYIKRYWPGFVAGKLSDLAGLIFFPLLLVALAEFAALLFHRPWRASRSTFIFVAVVVAVVFASTKAIEPVRNADEVALGWLWWLPDAAYRLATGEDAGSPGRHQVLADLSDLMALPCVLVAIWIGGKYRPADHHEHTDEMDQVEA